jgi:hypothetical protein
LHEVSWQFDIVDGLCFVLYLFFDGVVVEDAVAGECLLFGKFATANFVTDVGLLELVGVALPGKWCEFGGREVEGTLLEKDPLIEVFNVEGLFVVLI